MRYAAQRADGTWTGALYDELTPAISAHHAKFAEVVEPVLSLEKMNGAWTASLPSIAEKRAIWSVSRFQARQALRNAGLFDAAEAAVLGSGDDLLIAAWSEAQIFERTSPAIISMASALGLSATQVDDLFAAASVIFV